MIDDDLMQAMRAVIREEIDRIVPRLREPKPQLTILECARRYRTSYTRVRELIERGELDTVCRTGRNGRPQHLIKTESAERHPRLGGSA